MILCGAGLIRLQELFTMPSNTSYDMTVREFHADETGDYREALRMLKANEEYNLIVDCDSSEAYEILRQVSILPSSFFHDRCTCFCYNDRVFVLRALQ